MLGTIDLKRELKVYKDGIPLYEEVNEGVEAVKGLISDLSIYANRKNFYHLYYSYISNSYVEVCGLNIVLIYLVDGAKLKNEIKYTGSFLSNYKY